MSYQQIYEIGHFVRLAISCKISSAHHAKRQAKSEIFSVYLGHARAHDKPFREANTRNNNYVTKDLRLIYNIWSFSGLGGFRSSSMEAPGLHESNFNTQYYNDAIGLTSRWKVCFRQTFFSK